MNNSPPRQRGLYPSQLGEVSEANVGAALSPDYQLLWSLIMDPWNRLLHRRMSDQDFQRQEEGEAAQFLHSQIRIRAEAILPGHPRISVRRLKNGMFILNYDEKFAIAVEDEHPVLQPPDAD